MRKQLLWFSLLLPLDPLFCWDASISVTDTIVLAPRKFRLDIIGDPRTCWGTGKDTHEMAVETHKIDLAEELEIILAKYGMLRRLLCILDIREQIFSFLRKNRYNPLTS